MVMLRSPSKTCRDADKAGYHLYRTQLIVEFPAEAKQAARHYLDGDSCLLILVGREHLRLLGGDDSVPGDQLGHDSSNSLNTKGQGSNVKEKDICIKAKNHTGVSRMITN